MQTFLPYNDFKKTAACLDNRRLGKQRVEAYQILRIISGKRTSGGWLRHPAVLMWKGFSDALAAYQNSMITEWIDRGLITLWNLQNTKKYTNSLHSWVQINFMNHTDLTFSEKILNSTRNSVGMFPIICHMYGQSQHKLIYQKQD